MDTYDYPQQGVRDVASMFPLKSERVNHALATHYVVGDLLASLSRGVYVIEERVEFSRKMGKRRVTEFALNHMPTSAPVWQIEANRFLAAKYDYMSLPDEAFGDYGGREMYKTCWYEAMRGRLGRRGAATILGVCSSDYKSWQEKSLDILQYHLPDKKGIFNHFQRVREVLDDFSDAISRRDFYLEASVRGILEGLGVPKQTIAGLLSIREELLDYAEFRVVREMSGQLVTVYPISLRFSDDTWDLIA